MADVESASQQQETLPSVSNDDIADSESATNLQHIDDDVNNTDSAENGDKEQAAPSDSQDDENQNVRADSRPQEGEAADERKTSPAPEKEAVGDDNGNVAAATTGDDNKPPEDAAAAGESTEGGEEKPGEDSSRARAEGGDTAPKEEEQRATDGGEQSEQPTEDGPDQDAAAAPHDAKPDPPQPDPHHQPDQRQTPEEEKRHDGDQLPPTPTFDSDPERDEDDTARSQAAAVLQEAVQRADDVPISDTAEEAALDAIAAAVGAGAGAAGGPGEPRGGDNVTNPLLMSARTPIASDGLVVTSTTIKRLTNTPLEGAGSPAKPRTSQLPPVARGQVRGQQMTSSISDALQYAGQPSPKMLIRSRRPPKYIRLATVTVSPARHTSAGTSRLAAYRRFFDTVAQNRELNEQAMREPDKLPSRSRPLPQGPSLYYEEPKRPKKVITWEEANNSRPPLRIDMEGPTPCSYTPRVKPLNETNAPSFTFGTKCSPEKSGGARTSWGKPWFQSSHVWHTKVDFTRDNNWPSPNHYPKTSGLGPRQRTMPEAPSYTFGHKSAFSIIKAGATKEPSPNEYKRQTADKIVLPQGPAFTHQLRREGTTLWGSSEITPGPAAYSPSKPSPERPSFTIQGIRREKSHVLGPYSAL